MLSLLIDLAQSDHIEQLLLYFDKKMIRHSMVCKLNSFFKCDVEEIWENFRINTIQFFIAMVKGGPRKVCNAAAYGL